ncbi:hypothetical protein B0O80DRAFT_423566 [Mortierella sp. GBAus27b]|nr:hypothetical protein B0O80DRAFT_423566 [Mortierella sp. GBAus27b]
MKILTAASFVVVAWFVAKELRNFKCLNKDYGVVKIDYPKDHVGDALVLFNAQVHHNIMLTEDKDEIQRLQSLQQSPSHDPVESFLSQLDVWSRYSTGHVLARFSKSQFRLFQAAMALQQILETKRTLKTITERTSAFLKKYGSVEVNTATSEEALNSTAFQKRQDEKRQLGDIKYNFDNKILFEGYTGDVDENGDYGTGSMKDVFSSDWHIVDSNLQRTADEVAEGLYKVERRIRSVFDGYRQPEVDAKMRRQDVFMMLDLVRNDRAEDMTQVSDAEWVSAKEKLTPCLMRWSDLRVSLFSNPCEESNEDMDKEKYDRLDEVLLKCVNDWSKDIPISAPWASRVPLDARPKRIRTDDRMWFRNYHPYGDITKLYADLQHVYPELVTFIPSIGKTAEGRDIMAVKITAKGNDRPSVQKPQIWLQGLQHAREWESTMAVQSISLQFAKEYGNDPSMTSILDTFELVIIPVVNVDGYEYTWTTDRFWRKNRRQTENGAWGVDLNSSG